MWILSGNVVGYGLRAVYTTEDTDEKEGDPKMPTAQIVVGK
jgi:hypothetical protein